MIKECRGCRGVTKNGDTSWTVVGKDGKSRPTIRKCLECTIGQLVISHGVKLEALVRGVQYSAEEVDGRCAVSWGPDLEHCLRLPIDNIEKSCRLMLQVEDEELSQGIWDTCRAFLWMVGHTKPNLEYYVSYHPSHTRTVHQSQLETIINDLVYSLKLGKDTKMTFHAAIQEGSNTKATEWNLGHYKQPMHQFDIELNFEYEPEVAALNAIYELYEHSEFGKTPQFMLGRISNKTL